MPDSEQSAEEAGSVIRCVQDHGDAAVLVGGDEKKESRL